MAFNKRENLKRQFLNVRLKTQSNGLYVCKNIRKNKRAIIFFKTRNQSSNQSISLNHWSFNSLSFRNIPSDIGCFEKIFIEKEYDIYYSLKPKIIIDCGANIGFSTVFFKNKYKNAKIIAIEPDISNYQLLQRNTQLYDDIICENSAVWNKRVGLMISNPSVDKWGVIVKETIDSPTINALTINDIINEHNIEEIDILKRLCSIVDMHKYTIFSTWN